MSDIETAREALTPYRERTVANPINVPANEELIRAATQLERKIALSRPTEGILNPGLAKTFNTTPEYWVGGGELVAQDTSKPLTCVLFAHLCVYALKSAPKFTVAIEVVELRQGVDNHYILVAGRTSGDINGDLSGWNENAFVIDLWGARQGLGDLVSQPPAIIVTSMAAYPRKVAATIPPWGV
jgi:hypothetical protein